ncbi:hypothetical protein ES288_D08G255400v1 [Gossypium darwinii]|uniref:BHLH domain-containing protein n=1 Tax=Gossypium darwinii TaxID=34276 RepID=A0A5D2BQN1_GOSDA|nr:hypothetical protein ES288_D08G255400v1 [Gossypium darwinii]
MSTISKIGIFLSGYKVQKWFLFIIIRISHQTKKISIGSSFFLSFHSLFCNYFASLIPNLEPSPVFKRRKTEVDPVSVHPIQPNQTMKRWRTKREHQIYSSKLFQALCRSRRTSSSTSAKELHQTADRVLSITAKGTTRWSRAILAAPLTAGTNMKKHKKAKVTVHTRLRKPVVNREKKKLPVVERKLKALRRLVPEETSDYIAALEMQVRAMTAITEFLARGEAQAPTDRLGSIGNM